MFCCTFGFVFPLTFLDLHFESEGSLLLKLPFQDQLSSAMWLNWAWLGYLLMRVFCVREMFVHLHLPV